MVESLTPQSVVRGPAASPAQPEHVRNVDSRAPLQTYWEEFIFHEVLQMIHVHADSSLLLHVVHLQALE